MLVLVIFWLFFTKILNEKEDCFHLELLDEDAENELELATVLKNELELFVDILETSVCISISVNNAVIHFYSFDFSLLLIFMFNILIQFLTIRISILFYYLIML